MTIEKNKSIMAWLIVVVLFTISLFGYAVYNMYQSYQLSDNKNYKYHPICINNHLYIRLIPRLGVTPVFDRQYTEPRLIQCSVKNGVIIYDKDSLLLLNNE